MSFSETRPGTGARRIHSLDTARDPQNYTPFEKPKQLIELNVPVKKPEVWPGGSMQWVNRPIKKAGRKSAQHLLKGPAGEVKEEYKHVKSSQQAFELFFDDDIMKMILGTFEGYISIK